MAQGVRECDSDTDAIHGEKRSREGVHPAMDDSCVGAVRSALPSVTPPAKVVRAAQGMRKCDSITEAAHDKKPMFEKCIQR